MHYHMEIIMPPTEEVKKQVDNILNPFREDESGRGFWDWWEIGGRWAGIKEQAGIDPQRLQGFSDELTRRKVTVSAVQCGKPELMSAVITRSRDSLTAASGKPTITIIETI